MDALTLIVMTRLPREGGNKTRLIPALGARGAMEFHERLARHAIGNALGFCSAKGGRTLVVWLEGGTTMEGESWLGSRTVGFREQPDGDLGHKMRIASSEAFREGAEKVVIIGTDCPSINQEILCTAEESLDEKDIVFGPALDGGYYLIGLRAPSKGVFMEIPWGGSDVLERSLEAARREGLKVALLAPLADVDEPEDIPAAEEELRKASRLH